MNILTIKKRIPLFSILAVVGLSLAIAASASGATTCTFTTVGSEMLLNANCTTDSTILIPNGFTLDLNQYTITGIDPAGGHFVGAVVKNSGIKAEITNGTITVSSLTNVCDSGDNRLRGVMFQGASGSISNLNVVDISQGASGCQEGNAIEVRNFADAPDTTSVTIDSNTVSGYQKTGILANGDVNVTITNNNVTGKGAIGYIAQNGIQIGFGGTGMVKRNTVSGNSYTGNSTVSGGILIVGGPGYGGAFCVGVQVMQNTIRDNDVGVYISQYEADFSAPAVSTNIKVVNNIISNSAVTNGYVYQAGVSDVGNNDKIINNTISGTGYNPVTVSGSTFYVDADPAWTNKPKVHANK